MCVLPLSGPLRSIDLVLLSILFSLYIPPKHLTNKDHFISHIIQTPTFHPYKQNTAEVSGQMDYLAFSLELAIRSSPPGLVDKYVVFMHMDTFSIFNNPPMSATKETILMLTTAYVYNMNM